MISFRNLSFDYNGRSVLDDVSLSLPEGSFHFLTGPSGSGKSTLLKLCYLALHPSSGDGNILGLSTKAYNADDRSELRRRIGIVHQDCDFINHMTLAQNVMLPLQLADQITPKATQNLDELLSWVGLSDRRSALPAELSGGERQRAALARAIIMDPDIIIADEPTGNIDWDMAKRVIYLLIQLNKMGKTILVATHDLNMVRLTKSQVSTRVLRIKDRKIETAGTEL